MPRVEPDHLLFGVPDLTEGIRLIRSKLGVSPVPGGQHPGVGTHNALLSLGSTTYLEVIARDPSQDVPDRDLPYGLAGLMEPKLITWAARPVDWGHYTRTARSLGIKTKIREGSRLSPGGLQFRWRSAQLVPPVKVENHDLTGLLPFAIDWTSPQHPADSTPGNALLESLTLKHPNAQVLSMAVDELELPCEVGSAPEARISATIKLVTGETVTLE